MKNTPDTLQPPSFWRKLMSSLNYGLVGAAASMAVVLPFIVQKIKNSQGIEPHNRRVGVAQNLGLAGGVAGFVYGWNKPKIEYARSVASALQTENIALSLASTAAPDSAAAGQKSWTAAENAKAASAPSTQQTR